MEYQSRLVQVVQDKYKLLKRPWIRYVMDAPLQLDGNNSGVLALKVMEAVVNHESVAKIEPSQCSTYRKEIAEALL
jgi:hypothetical protein